MVYLNEIRKCLVLILLGVVFASCNRPMPFDKERWTRSRGFQGRHFIQNDLFVSGSARYRMALWLEKNYNFCDKSLNEILDKFFIASHFEFSGDSLALERVKSEKKLRIIKRQHDPNLIFGIDPWIDINWIEIYFDEDFKVSRVYYVKYNRRTGQTSRRKICEAKTD